jgi:hypothetical protein
LPRTRLAPEHQAKNNETFGLFVPFRTLLAGRCSW